jgi:pyridinium-3,5-bisthiocarboxylic acid mononucleotide nickel chelatase
LGSDSAIRSKGAQVSFSQDKVMLVETNVDDVDGEILAHTIERMIEIGAEDATLVPFIGKKGRPGFTLRVVCSRKLARNIADQIVNETGTFGVKMTEYTRFIASRRLLSVQVQFGSYKREVPVKISLGKNGRVIRIKPELEAIKDLAKIQNQTVREVHDRVTETARSSLVNSEGFLKKERVQV